jgi:hypothetical protein
MRRGSGMLRSQSRRFRPLPRSHRVVVYSSVLRRHAGLAPHRERISPEATRAQHSLRAKTIGARSLVLCPAYVASEITLTVTALTLSLACS